MPNIKKPNVGGYPAETTNEQHENTQAKKQIRNFNAKWSGVIQAIKNKETIHPSHIEQYMKERSALNIPSDLAAEFVPPEMDLGIKSRSDVQHGVSDQKNAKEVDYNKLRAEMKAKQPAAVELDYKRMAAEQKKPQREGVTLDYSKMGTKKDQFAQVPSQTINYAGKNGPTVTKNPVGDKAGRIAAIRGIAADDSKAFKDVAVKGGEKRFEGQKGVHAPFDPHVPGQSRAGVHARQQTLTSAASGRASPLAAKFGRAEHEKVLADLKATPVANLPKSMQKSEPALLNKAKELLNRAWQVAGEVPSLKKDKIPGGLADGKPESEFNPKDLEAGKKVEAEHTSSPAIASEIARDHLTEDPKYYAKLALMERAKKHKDALEKRCWKGYEPVPGKEPYSEGSCRPMNKEVEELSKPPKSEAQRRFMGAVAAGNVEGVPSSVGEKFLAEDKGGKLPEKIEKDWQVAGEVPPLKKEEEHSHDQGTEMAERQLLGMLEDIEKIASSFQGKDLPDWLEAKLTQAAQHLQECASFMATGEGQELEKSPGLSQGSKLGREIYDEVANLKRKATRTGREAVGAGIRAEQKWGGKDTYRSSKQQADAIAKKDAKANKKQPVKTLADLSPEERKALEEQYSKK